MTKRILIDSVRQEEVRVAMVDGTKLQEFDFETQAKKQLKGNVYLGKITRVEPSLQAVFVEYGGNRQGFLPFSEVHFDYYQIPIADKEKLAAAIATADEQAEPEQAESKQAGSEQAEPEQEKHEDNAEDEAIRIANDLEKAFAEEFAENSEPYDESSSEEDLTESPETKIKRFEFYRKYKVQEVLKRNQILLVQVVKEERGNKGSSLTTYTSFAGRYCVLMPNTDRAGGVSRRISDSKDRNRLRDILSRMELKDGMSAIIRTAGVDRKDLEIESDLKYLMSLWENIKKNTLESEAPSLIHEEGNLIKRSLRDLFRSDVDEVIIEGEEGYNSAKKFMEIIDPDYVSRIKKYSGSNPLFQHHKIENQLDELYKNTARLPSGGSLVITPTEALVSIDVNSGRSTKEKNIEDTAVKTNIEAAEEIARQLRLRDLAGLVVIDFIDMRELKNKRAVEKTLKAALKVDRARIQLQRISALGLLEMSRQRMRSSIVEASTIKCPRCSGTGIVRSNECISITILRAIEGEIGKCKDILNIRMSADTALFLLNDKREELVEIQKSSGIKVIVKTDGLLSDDEYVIEKSRPPRRKREPKKIPEKIAKEPIAEKEKSTEKKVRKRTPRNRKPAENQKKEDNVKPLPVTSEKEPPKKEVVKNSENDEKSSRIKGLWKKITQ